MDFFTIATAASGSTAGPIISPDFILRFLLIALTAVVIIFIGGIVLAGIALHKAGASVLEPVRQLVVQGEIIRITAVIFIVSAATVLAMMGIIKGEAMVSILSGVAGYVLGSSQRKDKPPADVAGPKG
jgi:hypothetical protein